MIWSARFCGSTRSEEHTSELQSHSDLHSSLHDALPISLERERLGDGRGERRLAVVDVTDRADVHVRLGALELLLSHFSQGGKPPFYPPTFSFLVDDLVREVLR